MPPPHRKPVLQYACVIPSAWVCPNCAAILCRLGETIPGVCRRNMALDAVLLDPENQGYETGTIVLPALAVGAPHRRQRCAILAYRPRKYGQRDGTAWDGWGQFANSGSLAHAGYQQPPGRGEIAKRGQGEPCGKSTSCSVPGCVADAHSQRCGTQRKQGGMGGVREKWENKPMQAAESGVGNAECGGPTEPGLGGMLDGVARRLDGIRWPAWRGQEQHDWEPPRVGVNIPNRADRLRCLGNMVVPWQFYPIFAAIAELERMAAWP